MTAKTPKATALRAVFYRNVMQALKTKTGAVQTAAVKRIFHLAVRDLPDAALASLSTQMDYAPRGMATAYYVNLAEGVVIKLLEATPCHLDASRDDKHTKSVSYNPELALGHARGQKHPVGSGLAWLGRHPEQETEEQLARKTKPPVRIQAVLARMGVGG